MVFITAADATHMPGARKLRIYENVFGDGLQQAWGLEPGRKVCEWAKRLKCLLPRHLQAKAFGRHLERVSRNRTECRIVLCDPALVKLARRLLDGRPGCGCLGGGGLFQAHARLDGPKGAHSLHRPSAVGEAKWL